MEGSRKITAVCALVGLAFLTTGCGPENGALAAPPVGVSYGTGDMNDTIDGQLGLASSGPSAEVTGGFGFGEETEVRVSCGPVDGVFRLRFQPAGGSSPLLTLRVPQEGHGSGHGGERGNGHGGDDATGGRHGPAAEAVLLRLENGRLEKLTGTARVSMHPATHAAGRHAVSGSFTAELDGTTLEGSFESCFHFTG